MFDEKGYGLERSVKSSEVLPDEARIPRIFEGTEKPNQKIQGTKIRFFFTVN